MDRLTKKYQGDDGYDGYYMACTDTCTNFSCSFCERDAECLNKLGEYEDAVEAGKIIERKVIDDWLDKLIAERGDYSCIRLGALREALDELPVVAQEGTE